MIHLHKGQYPDLIITAALGHWYPRGQARLIESLRAHNWQGHILQITDEWPMGGYNPANPYNIKAAAIEYALKIDNWDSITWVDCSAWAVKNLEDWWTATVFEQDFWIGRSGFNARQTCSDRCLDYFGIDYDEAVNIPDVHSAIFIEDILTRPRILPQFIEACKAGAADGSRLHDNQSKDPRFLFHRQDQSVLTCILHKEGLLPAMPNTLTAYDVWDNKADSVYFYMRGM